MDIDAVAPMGFDNVRKPPSSSVVSVGGDVFVSFRNCLIAIQFSLYAPARTIPAVFRS
jgi:hypothetical protein